MKKFKLLKDLPEVEAGAIFEFDLIPYAPIIDIYKIHGYKVGNYPDWFEEVKEEPEAELCDPGFYQCKHGKPDEGRNCQKCQPKKEECGHGEETNSSGGVQCKNCGHFKSIPDITTCQPKKEECKHEEGSEEDGMFYCNCGTVKCLKCAKPQPKELCGSAGKCYVCSNPSCAGCGGQSQDSPGSAGKTAQARCELCHKPVELWDFRYKKRWYHRTCVESHNHKPQPKELKPSELIATPAKNQMSLGEQILTEAKRIYDELHKECEIPMGRRKHPRWDGQVICHKFEASYVEMAIIKILDQLHL